MKSFLFPILAILGANFYVFFRIWNMIPPVTGGRITFLFIALTVLSCVFLFIPANSLLPVWLASAVYKTGTSWMIIMLYLLMIFLVADLLRLIGVRPIKELLFSNGYAVIGLAVILFIVFASGYLNYNHKRRTALVLSTAAYPGITEPLRVVALSDLHLGNSIGPKELSRWIDRINAEKPDMVLIAGDLIDNGVRPLYHKDMAGLCRKIESRYGVYMVPGNHEYHTGIRESATFAAEAGITFLKDSVVLVAPGVYIAGRDDRMNSHRKPLSELLAGLDPSYPVVLLDHQPYQLEQAEQNGVFLQLSGHTHRGQVWPISRITDKIYEISYGYGQKGQTHYYVSSGLGIWGGKFRIGTRSEYVVIDFQDSSVE